MELLAAALLLMALRPPAKVEEKPKDQPAAGGDVAKDVVGAGAGIAGLVASLGGGGTAAAGGTGAAATGGTAAAAAGGGGSSTTSTSETAAGVAAGVEAVGDTSILGSAVGGGFLLIAVLAMVALAAGIGAVSKSNTDELARRRKRERYFEEWWTREDDTLESLLKSIEASDGNPVARTTINTENYGLVTLHDGFQYHLPTIITAKVTDGRVPRELLANARLLGRWFGIWAGAFKNRAMLNWFAAHGQAPNSSNKPPDYVNGYLYTQGPRIGAPWLKVQPPVFVPDIGQIPAMLEADYWELANNYCATQPFANEPSAPPTAPLPVTTHSLLLTALSGGGAVTQSTFADRGTLAYPGPITGFGDVVALNNFAAKTLGDNYARLLQMATVLGYAAGMSYAAAKAYDNAVWPGDERFTREIGQQCGCPFTVVEQVLVVPTAVGQATAGHQRWVLREQTYGMAIDVVASREQVRPVSYMTEELA